MHRTLECGETGAEALYCAQAFEVLQVDSDSSFVLLHSTLETRRLARQIVDILLRCRFPRTIAAHLDHLARCGFGRNKSAICQLLEHFIEVGLFTLAGVSDSDDRHLGVTRPSQDVDVVVVTKDRPEYVSRCIHGFCDNFRTYGHSPNIIVVDASTDSASREITARLLRRYHAESGIASSYRTLFDKRHLQSRIIEELDDSVHDIISFLLGTTLAPDEYDVGASTNYALLTSVNKVLFRIDDDVVPRFFSGQPSAPDTSFDFNVARPPLQRFASREHSIEGKVQHEIDCLGEVLGALSRADKYLTGPHGWSDSDLGCRIRADIYAPAPLVSVSFGTVGDCGSWSNEFLLQDLYERSHKADAQADLSHFDEGRDIFQCVGAYALSTTFENFCTMCTAIPVSEVTAPFFPCYRNSDGMWAYTMQYGVPHAVNAQIPYAVLHDPPQRSLQFPVNWFAPVYSVPVHFAAIAILQYAVECSARVGFTVGHSALGRMLADIASQDSQAFALTSTIAVSKRLAALLRIGLSIRRAAKTEAVAHASKELTDALERTIECFDRNLFAKTNGKSGESIRRLQERTSLFGRSLQLWPQLRAAAGRASQAHGSG